MIDTTQYYDSEFSADVERARSEMCEAWGNISNRYVGIVHKCTVTLTCKHVFAIQPSDEFYVYYDVNVPCCVCGINN